MRLSSTPFVLRGKHFKNLAGFLVFAFIFSLGLPAAAKKPGKTEKSAASRVIAVSDSLMTLNQAKAWCQQHGGRLPLVNGKTSLNSKEKTWRTEGFGAAGARWPAYPPIGVYWTGTTNPGWGNYRHITVDAPGGGDRIGNTGVQSNSRNYAACVR